MAALIIFTRERTRDQSEMDIYSSKAGATLAGHQDRPIALYGANETLEGAPIEGAVVVEFPSIEAAKAWYNSPAYVEARAHRHLGADYRVFITETM